MAFISSFNNIAKYFHVRNDKPVIDDYIFQFHYKLTTNILLMFCVLLTSINLIGNPIQCMTNLSKKDDVRKVINTYCWISSTFTYNNNPDFHQSSNINEDKIKIRYHSYYQWVPFMLFFQAITFYVPHWIWKMWEGGKIRIITNDLRGLSMDSVQERLAKQNKLVQYFIESFHMHSTYALGYIFCEIINVINICANIYVTNKFIGEYFLTYGFEVFKYNENDQNHTDPMEEIFPRLTKCNFYKYGSSGTIQKMDALCILAQNVLNEKIYLFLWIWFFMLAIMSILALLYRIAIITQIIKKTSSFNNIFKLTNNTLMMSSLFRKCQIGDFLLLHLIEKNVNHFQFKEIMKEICANLNLENSYDLHLDFVPY
ncbi:innexin inx3-like isoform X2 [Sipha flava]|uniref:Innexin n=1 Tax=Sipha flava TaxID=143950 RepID=A0A8B8F7H3_9HEMI|nr:innexin inx3-like isoform X2 [Sipha flava]